MKRLFKWKKKRKKSKLMKKEENEPNYDYDYDYDNDNEYDYNDDDPLHNATSPNPIPEVTKRSEIPLERDRKALLGCWATVLAYSNAHYAQISELTPENTIVQSDQTTTDDSFGPTKKERVQAELDQHLRRRYRFHCDLLLSAGQSLELDSEYVVALLPLLEHLSRRGDELEHENDTIIDTPIPSFSLDDQGHENQPDVYHQIMALHRIRKLYCLSKPFLDDMAEGAGFRCIAILLIKSILNASYGYDARYRSDIKRLAIVVFIHQQRSEPGDDLKLEHVEQASNLFHKLEHSIGSKLLLLTFAQTAQDPTGEGVEVTAPDDVIRGIQVASAGVVAGTILAVTGGLAAPAIAAGLAGVLGTTLATSSIVLSLTSTAAITAIFGVGGGTYVAHKMHRRTEGLTEFELQKEFQPTEDDNLLHRADDAQLFSTIAVSGWVRDRCDFQRPWGVQPTNPPIIGRKELLERFYTLHNPSRLRDCENVLREWKGYEEYLWAHLKWKYGCDPDDPFSSRSPKPPLDDLHNEILERLCIHYKLCSTMDIFDALREFDAAQATKEVPRVEEKEGDNLVDSMHGPNKKPTGFMGMGLGPSSDGENDTHTQPLGDEPAHTKTVWDYRSRYYGELYTVRFECELMKEFCDYVRKMVVEETAHHVGAHALKYTMLSALMSAMAVPGVMLKITDLVDEKMTMVLERADTAGIVLAKSLLDSRDAGQRPVNLIGYSFGARIVFSCLQELARSQIIWERSIETKEELGFSREPASVVEDAVLIGLPRNLTSSFHLVRQVVAGRFVNCYSKKDWFMAMLWQVRQAAGLKLNNAQRPFAGTSPIDVPGVENIDISDLVEVQSDYCDVQGEILERVRLGHPAY